MSTIAEVIAYLQDEVPRRAAAHAVPGVAIGLCDRDDILWAEGFGTTRGHSDGNDQPMRSGPGRPIGIDTMFSVQSTSKLYTATGVLAAVQDGLVDLDVPILQYLPDFTVGSDFEDHPERRITLRHLLTHTAGFTHDAPIGSNYEVSDATFEEHLASIQQTYLRFPVGHHHEYSNLGIDVAGQVVVAASGQRFAEFMRGRLFEPLGLVRSTFDFLAYDADDDAAFGHSRAFASSGRPLPRRVPMVPSGGLYASVGDVLRYLQFQLRGGEEVVAPQVLRQHLEFPKVAVEQTRGYGLGLYVDRWEPGVEVLHHGGAGFGFLCQVFWSPEVGIGGAILTNALDHDIQNELAADIVRMLADGRAARPVPGFSRTASSKATSVAAASAEAILGQYVGRLSDVVRIAVRDGRLVRVSVTEELLDLDDELTATVDDPAGGPPTRLVFLRDSAGHVRYLLEPVSGDVRYRTWVPELPPASLASSVLGDYVSRQCGVPMSRYRLRQDGTHPAIEFVSCDASDNQIVLQLTSVGGNRYLSATGEVLTITDAGLSYGGIPLTRPDTHPSASPARQNES